MVVVEHTETPVVVAVEADIPVVVVDSMMEILDLVVVVVLIMLVQVQ